MLTVIKDFGKIYNCPFQVQFDKENTQTPFRVEMCGNGHYFQSEKEAFTFAESEIDEYFRKYRRRRTLR